MTVFKITWKTHLFCSIISIAMAAVILNSVVLSLLQLFVFSTRFHIVQSEQINCLIYFLAVATAVSSVHEFFHGVGYYLWGGRVRFGFRFSYAYVQETSGISISRTRFLIVLLLPLISISLLGLIMGGWFGRFIYILNLLGSSGDILMSVFLLRCGYSDMIVDKKYGFDILTNDVRSITA